MRKTCAIFAVGAVVLAGCGGSVDGSAVADSPLEPWNPCSIPADAIAEAGLDPDSMIEGWSDGISVSEWSRCLWKGPTGRPNYYFSILTSPTHSSDDERSDTTHTSMSDTTIGDRPAFRYIADNQGPNKECSIAIDTASGVVNTMVYAMGGIEMTVDPCSLVETLTAGVEPYLPPTQ